MWFSDYEIRFVCLVLQFFLFLLWFYKTSRILNSLTSTSLHWFPLCQTDIGGITAGDYLIEIIFISCFSCRTSLSSLAQLFTTKKIYIFKGSLMYKRHYSEQKRANNSFIMHELLFILFVLKSTRGILQPHGSS